jgi:hypothetical protein
VTQQGSQTSEYSYAVDLSNDNDRHHMPLSEPTQTSPEVPHDPYLLWRHGECLGFFYSTALIVLESIAIVQSPATASDVL